MSRNNAGLSAERIITEALHIIDGRGLGGLTMRRLGDALEVEAMAIYHHFPLGKEQLFDAIVEHITDVSPAGADGSADADDPEEEPDPDAQPPADERPWDERLRAWAHDYRAGLLRHSGALSLIIHRRPDTTAALRSLELHYAAFTEAGLSGADVVRAAATLDSYVTGAVIHQVRAEGIGSHDPAAVDGRHPTVAALRGTALDHDARFADGLEAVLAGLRPA
ncbi:AcrR family transcriptional regulator [Spinactinospora alkalitolerans]|uniref:AcrR family transcriptional regulator n=1 Tax=Spinactinospora alkalitolerans TaxID=687207 RepID=A0A852TWI5_9ACTN|nr:TetR/AcrR family transcriptional regulator [Spinactinospora alkalitolerans]NYE48288.1 AcrR family transcriptional regulator [Spinactinospora alkalitolerans]